MIMATNDAWNVEGCRGLTEPTSYELLNIFHIGRGEENTKLRLYRGLTYLAAYNLELINELITENLRQ